MEKIKLKIIDNFDEFDIGYQNINARNFYV